MNSDIKYADMRSAYGNTLVELGSVNKDIVCVGSDTTDSLKTKKFGDKFPERFFNIGIAEANLVSIAAGLAIGGKIAFASTYAAFLPGRCLDQIRNAICYPDLNVKLVVSHAGLTVGPDGASHQQIEDLSIMRSIPNMKVITPSDAVAVTKLIKNIVETQGPFYMRLARPSSEVIYDENDSDFKIGQGNILRDGSDMTIISCGLMVYKSLKVANNLKKDYGISCRVIDCYSIKPIDRKMIIKAAKETGSIITVEEHNYIGGLGSAVAEVCCDEYPCHVKRIGIMDTFGESARDTELDLLLEKYGLSEKEIERNVLNLTRIINGNIS
ncbi:MAG: transketolase family protein [Nitrososphaeraceae archaeon]|nr:transketolase family protein [Nitrososphaeraceae archaeon]